MEGTITGIEPYGAFVSLDEETSGLIHISEISEGFGPATLIISVHVHDHRVKVKIIDFETSLTHQARLSLKALHPTAFRKRNAGGGRLSRLPVMKIGFRAAGRKPGPLGFEEANKGETV